MEAYVYGIISLIVTGVVQYWLTQYARKHYTEWNQRRIHVGTFGLKRTLILTNVITSLTALTAYSLCFIFNSPTTPLLDSLIPYSAGIVMWVGVFSAVTDLFSLKVPIDLAVRGYWAVFPPAVLAVLFSGDNWKFIALSIFVFWFWAMFLYFFFGGGFGQADVRMMILHAFGLTWWVGIDWVFYAFLIACILQICFHPLSAFIRVGKRRAKGQRYNKNVDKIPPAVEVYDDDTVFSPIPQKKSYLPLVPALSFVYTIVIFVSLFMDRTGCSAYEGIFCS